MRRAPHRAPLSGHGHLLRPRSSPDGALFLFLFSRPAEADMDHPPQVFPLRTRPARAGGPLDVAGLACLDPVLLAGPWPCPLGAGVLWLARDRAADGGGLGALSRPALSVSPLSEGRWSDGAFPRRGGRKQNLIAGRWWPAPLNPAGRWPLSGCPPPCRRRGSSPAAFSGSWHAPRALCGHAWESDLVNWAST